MIDDQKRLAQFVNAAIRSDAGAWFESGHAKIYPKDRSRGLIRPKCNYLQRKFQKTVVRFEELGLPVRIVELKPRQKGSTTFCCAEDYCHLRRKSASAVLIGGQYSQTTQAWGMMQTYQDNDSFDWANTGKIDSKSGSWTNGSKLIPETAKDAVAGISGTHQVLHCTEVARWASYGVANATEVLTNILKCVPLLPDTMIILESTAAGAAGDFYNRWLGSVDAEKFIAGEVDIQAGQFVRVFAPWFEFEDSAMDLTDKQREHIKATLDEDAEFAGEKLLIERYGRTDENGILRLGTAVKEHDAYEQLAWRRWSIREECHRDLDIFARDYPSSWQEAFKKSGSLRFNSTGLSMLRKRLDQRTPIYGLLEDTKDRRVTFRQTEPNESKVIIFEKPYAGRRYILTVDPMTGETQVGGLDPDWHSVFVLRDGYWDNMGKWVRMATAARIIWNRWDIDVLEKPIWQLARYYGPSSGCTIAIEMNMDRGLTELLKARGANLYQRELFNQREQKSSNAYGFQTNEKTREMLVESLARKIREWDTPGDGIDIFCAHAVEQCENFVRKMNGRSEAEQGFHDDDVIAIAMGVELMDHGTIYMPMRSLMDLPPDLRPPVSRQGLASQYS